ncbi:MAG: SRPBCC domain-containing protein [Actinobacteria bacterium]|nr:SRPBCC domain-containing protein [Actinomycetota bacterium]
MQGNNPSTLPDIQKKIMLNAPIERVWQAVATSEGIAEWCMPNDFQPEAGHVFHLQTPFGATPCKVLELDPPRRLSFSWDDFGWRVLFELQEVEGKTEFTLTHSGWGAADEIIPRTGMKQAMVHEIMNNGWEPMIRENLRKVVEG